MRNLLYQKGFNMAIIRMIIAGNLLKSLVVLCFSVLLGGVVCSAPGYCKSLAESKPNVIMLLLDTVRADHLGIHGYKFDTSKNLDALAADSIVYDNCISSAPWTAPSMGTILTSRHPHEHHCGERIKGEPWRGNPETMGKIRDNLPTIATILDSHGFESHVVLANPVLKEFGLFDSFMSIDDAPGKDSLVNCRRADSVTDSAIDWLANQQNDTPFLLVVHYIDPHAPYDPVVPPDNKTIEHYSKSFGVSLKRAKAIAYYDYEIRFMDAQIGRLLAFLKGKRAYDESLIVTVADHGEEFWDHFVNEEKIFGPTVVCGNQHGETLFQELLHVPLFIKFPHNEGAGQRISRLVGSIDVMPTVLEYLSLTQPKEVRGVVLPRQNEEASGKRMVFSEYLANLQEQKSVTWQSGPTLFKLILGMESKKKRWFNLVMDPAELSPKTEVPMDEENRQISEALARFVTPPNGNASKRKVISDKAIKSLKTLGYMK